MLWVCNNINFINTTANFIKEKMNRDNLSFRTN